MLPVLQQMIAKSIDVHLQAEESRIPSIADFAMDLKALPTRDLVALCVQTSNEAARNEFVLRTSQTIRGVVYKRVSRCTPPTQELVQDFTNSAYIKLLQALPRFEWQDEPRFFGWVKRVTLNTIEDSLRIRKPEDPVENLDMFAEHTSSEKQIELELQCNEIDQCLHKIGAADLEIDIFWLHFRDGYTAREISEMPYVVLHEDRVETILARLVRQLRREIGGGGSKDGN